LSGNSTSRGIAIYLIELIFNAEVAEMRKIRNFLNIFPRIPFFRAFRVKKMI